MMTDEQALRFWKALFLLTDLLRDRTILMKNVSRGWNITVQQIRLLRALERLRRNGAPDGVMLKSLAKELGVTSASVSGMVETLVKRNILSRKQADDDRRSVRITLSESSRNELAQLEHLMTKMTVHLLPNLTENEINETTERLEKLTNVFESAVPSLQELLPAETLKAPRKNRK